MNNILIVCSSVPKAFSSEKLCFHQLPFHSPPPLCHLFTPYLFTEPPFHHFLFTIPHSLPYPPVPQPDTLSLMIHHLGCVSFLNSKPLIDPVLDNPNVQVHFAVPADLLALFDAGNVSAAFA